VTRARRTMRAGARVSIELDPFRNFSGGENLAKSGYRLPPAF
jgi:hypothetical protein